MTEQNESRTEESKANEVIIVKRRTLTNCEEYVSIQLKSSDEIIIYSKFLKCSSQKI